MTIRTALETFFATNFKLKIRVELLDGILAKEGKLFTKKEAFEYLEGWLDEKVVYIEYEEYFGNKGNWHKLNFPLLYLKYNI